MATWKKVLVSGSIIEGSSAIIDGNLAIGGFPDVSASLAAAVAGTAAAGDGIFVTGNVVSVNSSSLAGAGLVANGPNKNIDVNVDDSTIEIATDTVQVKDLGITTGKLAASAVTSAKIASDSVTFAQLSGSAVVTSTETIASNDNDTTIPTSAAVKDYVDAQVTAQDLDGTADSGTFAVDLDSQTFTVAGGAGIQTTGSGQTVTINIGNGLVTNAMLAGSITNAKLTNSSITIGDTVVSLGGTAATINNLTLTGVKATGSFQGNLDGNALTATTATTANSVAANSVTLGTDTTGSYVATITNATNGGTIVTNGSGDGALTTVGLNLNDLSAATVNVAADSIAIIDADASNGTRKESIADLVAGITGTNLTATSGVISLSDNVTIGNDLTVSGDLTVIGTASFQNTTNLEVADRFILLASGSNATGDGGIVVQQATQNVGEAFLYDADTLRWGVADAITANVGAVAPDAFMAAVSTGNADSDTAIDALVDARYQAKGNIFIGDDEGIWIYS